MVIIIVFHTPAITIDQLRQIPIGIIGINVTGQRSVADADTRALRKSTVGERIGGRTGLDGCQKVTIVGVACRQGCALRQAFLASKGWKIL